MMKTYALRTFFSRGSQSFPTAPKSTCATFPGIVSNGDRDVLWKHAFGFPDAGVQTLDRRQAPGELAILGVESIEDRRGRRAVFDERLDPLTPFFDR